MGNPKQLTKEQAADIREFTLTRMMERTAGVTIHKYAKNDYRVFIHPYIVGTDLYDNGAVGKHKDYGSFQEVIEGVVKIKEGRDGK